MSVAAEPTPRVSVVVRTRNRPGLLEGALADILGQSFTDFEIVLVDDGDDPRPASSVVDRVVGARALTRVLDRTTEDHGRSRAANAGIRASRGEYIVLHDDDDSWDPEFLAATVGFLDTHPDCMAVSARTEVLIQRLDELGNPARIDRGPLNAELDAITIPDMLRANRVTTNSLLYRSSVHDEIGMIDESLAVHEDWDFYLRLLVRYPIELLPSPPLARWHHRPGAVGDEANSVFALNSEHEIAHARVGDDHLRRAIAQHGLGEALHLAHEVNRLEDRVEQLLRASDSARADANDELRNRLDAIDGTLASLADLRQLILERTSVSSGLRRLRSLFTRR